LCEMVPVSFKNSAAITFTFSIAGTPIISLQNVNLTGGPLGINPIDPFVILGIGFGATSGVGTGASGGETRVVSAGRGVGAFAPLAGGTGEVVSARGGAGCGRIGLTASLWVAATAPRTVTTSVTTSRTSSGGMSGPRQAP